MTKQKPHHTACTLNNVIGPEKKSFLTGTQHFLSTPEASSVLKVPAKWNDDAGMMIVRLAPSTFYLHTIQIQYLRKRQNTHSYRCLRIWVLILMCLHTCCVKSKIFDDWNSKMCFYLSCPVKEVFHLTFGNNSKTKNQIWGKMWIQNQNYFI